MAKAKKEKVYNPSRPIVASVYNRQKKTVKYYWFSSIEKAIPRCTFHAMYLEPGFMIELTHAVSGLWIGHIKVKVNRKFETDFVWDEEKEK